MPTKVRLVKAMVFPVVMYGCESWTVRKAERRRIDAFEHLLKEGFTTEYGAREMDRVIAQQLKPLLMREILFGSLKNGGSVTIGLVNGQCSIVNGQ